MFKGNNIWKITTVSKLIYLNKKKEKTNNATNYEDQKTIGKSLGE